MKYPSELYRKAEDILRNRRDGAAAELRMRKETARTQYPELYTLYRDVCAHGILLGRQLITASGEDAAGHLQAHRDRQAQLTAALEAAGLEPEHFQERPFCSLCGDRGFVDGRSCECRDAILNQLAYEWLSNISRVKECSFDTFRLDYYTGENVRTMRRLLTSCRRYAEGFSNASPSLLFQGPPGLGKTHLSLAIAGEVVQKGFLVLYASAPQLLQRLVDIRFDNGAADEYEDIAYHCDLLIIDDLGTEFQTRFTRSEVYNLVNTRGIEGRPTIINTNLSAQELAAIYDERVVSRLQGEYKANRFSGKDIRLQQRLEKEEHGHGETNDKKRLPLFTDMGGSQGGGPIP